MGFVLGMAMACCDLKDTLYNLGCKKSFLLHSSGGWIVWCFGFSSAA